MKKLLLLPCLATIVLLANNSPFSAENPYESISTIENKQIVGDNFVEVYESQNKEENSSFDFFGLLNSDDEQQFQDLCDPAIEDCDPTDPPIPVPINKYQFILVLIGMGLIFKRKLY